MGLSFQNQKKRYFLEAPATSQFVLKVVQECQKLGATRVTISFKEGKSLEMIFTTPSESEEKTNRSFGCTAAFWKSILQAFQTRVFASKDSEESTSSTLNEHVLKLQYNGEPLTASVYVNPGVKDKIPSLEIRNIEKDNTPISFTAKSIRSYNQSALEQCLQADSGIVLADFTHKTDRLDAFRTLAAARPRFRLAAHPETIDDLRKIISCAKEQPILLGWNIEDPIEAIFEIATYARDDKELMKEFFELLEVSFLRKEVRKTCKHCAKVTPISTALLEKLPEVFQERKEKYMFGRGCPQCNHSTYDGIVSLESTFILTSEIRELLFKGATPGQVTEIASREGARSLLEDGLDKIDQQLTTFEELLGSVKRISPGFLSAAVHRSNDKNLITPAEEELNTALSSFEPEYFFSQKDSSKPSLLIVEDNADQRDILASVLESEGYTVHTANHGQEALEVLEEQEAHIIICDLMMPVMNGEEFVRQIRKTPQQKHLPVLMLTAIDDEDTEYNLLAAGADDYCSKGMKKKVILKRIEKLLTRSQNPLNA